MLKALKRLFGSEEPLRTYRVTFYCENCGAMFTWKVPYGQPSPQFAWEVGPCPHCGVQRQRPLG